MDRLHVGNKQHRILANRKVVRGSIRFSFDIGIWDFLLGGRYEAHLRLWCSSGYFYKSESFLVVPRSCRGWGVRAGLRMGE